MEKKNFKILIKVITGLHIGVGNDKPEIGGIDNQFIKDPVSKLPYIPGSTLKGKIRSLLETESKLFNSDVIKTCFEGDNKSPTRFIFRDINLTDEYQKQFENGQILTEIKTEIKINRQKGTAEGGALRTTERIPPKIEFEGDFLMRVIDDNDASLCKSVIEQGIKLLNNDYLGGSGSRGYGAVEVKLTENKSE